MKRDGRAEPVFAVGVAVDPRQSEAVKLVGAGAIVGRSVDALARYAVVLQTVPPTLWNMENDQLFELPAVNCECGNSHPVSMEQIMKVWMEQREAVSWLAQKTGERP